MFLDYVDGYIFPPLINVDREMTMKEFRVKGIRIGMYELYEKIDTSYTTDKNKIIADVEEWIKTETDIPETAKLVRVSPVHDRACYVCFFWDKSFPEIDPASMIPTADFRDVCLQNEVPEKYKDMVYR